MSILNVEHLSHGFGDRAIFQDVSFRLLKGEHIGLIGANGEGKSTFMNIITGHMQPDEGKVEWSKRVRVGYLDQHTVLEKGMTIREVLKSAFSFLFELEVQMNEICDHLGEASEDEMNVMMEELGTIQDLLMNHDFYSIDAKVEEVGRALGLTDIGLDRDVTDLSGGQRTKVLLGKLLLEKPDILLLDEPTNYLDVQHIEWLKRYLQEYENAFILISHDVPFLNSVVNIIYHMENQRLDRYVGDYDKFLEVHEAKKAQLEAAYKRQQQEIAQLQDFVARNKARVSTRNMAMSRQKKLDKMDVIELAKEKPKPEFNFLEARASGKCIFETEDLVIGYDEPLSRPLNLYMERGEKIAMVGANGIGKTTLLKSILGLIPAVSGKVTLGDYLSIGYFEQEMAPGNTTTCIDEIWKEFPSYTQYQVRSALAKCGLTTQHIESQVRVLSGGEQAKVRLCKLINRETNLLLLDEPLGALDLKLRQDMQYELIRLKNELGITFIYVTHDQEEALTMSDTIVVMNQGYIQQMGTPEQIYNEPENAFVADFIGESNIVHGIMLQDELVEIFGAKFACVDKGFGTNKPVDVVIRPEDIDLVEPEKGTLVGTVTHLIFKGVHYEMEVTTPDGFEWLVHSTDMFPVGKQVGIHVDPFDIQIMNKPASEDEEALGVDE